jgi:hypothetical protein
MIIVTMFPGIPIIPVTIQEYLAKNTKATKNALRVGVSHVSVDWLVKFPDTCWEKSPYVVWPIK